MTSFTRIPEEDSPSIDVDIRRRLSKIGMLALTKEVELMAYFLIIDPNIYGGFME
jgi:hypothetical protein